MSEQGSIFDEWPVVDYPTEHIGPPEGMTIAQAFTKFHDTNPHVYEELLKLSRRLLQAGARRLSINMLFEVLRYRYTLRTQGDEFKLNNNYRSYYARLLMSRDPELAGKFETRVLHAREKEASD